MGTVDMTSIRVEYPKPVRDFMPSGIQYTLPSLQWPASTINDLNGQYTDLSRWQTCGGADTVTVYEAATVKDRDFEMSRDSRANVKLEHQLKEFKQSRLEEDKKVDAYA